MKLLKKFYQEKDSDYSIVADWKQGSNTLDIQFEVRIPDEKEFYQTTKFEVGNFENWGLWDFDVVEFFLQDRSEGEDSPYYEFQVSPLNQQFALKVVKPRKDFYTPKDIFFDSNVWVGKSNGQNLWQTEMKVAIPEFRGDKLYGNLHACLGNPCRRQFFGLAHYEGDEPDFHRPEAFIKLK